jgi:Holliday junction resolvase RusA-like endonuclease
MSRITFSVPGAPVGKGRPRVGRVGGHARLFTPQKTASYEGLVAHAAHAAMAGRPLLDQAVGVSLVLACPVPASWSQKKQRAALAGEIRPTSKPDVDNVVKAIFDGLNGVLWRDDVLVTDLSVAKRYSDKPCVDVMVWTISAPLTQEKRDELMGAF